MNATTQPNTDRWEGITAPRGTIRHRAQLIVDHHVSFGKLLYGSAGLEASIVEAMGERERKDWGLLKQASDLIYLLEASHNLPHSERRELIERAMILRNGALDKRLNAPT